MESARTVVSAVRLVEGKSMASAAKSSLDAGGAKLRKSTGGAVGIRSVVDDGGGGDIKSESGGQLGVPRLELTLRKGSKQPQAAAETFVAGKTTVRTSKNGRGMSSNSNSLLLKRRRLKRNLSAAAATATTSTVSTGGGKMNSVSSSSLHTRSLDRKTLLRHRQNMLLQPADRQWVRADLHRGSIHVHDKLTHSYPRPVLCTLETTAGEIACRLSQLSSKSGTVVRLIGKAHPTTDLNGNCSGKYNFNHPLCQHNEHSSGFTHLSSPRRSEYRGRQEDQPGDRLRLLLLDKEDGPRPEYDISLYSSDTQSDDNLLHHSLVDFNSNINADTPNDDDDSERRFNGNDMCGRNSGSDVESSAFDDLSSGARLSEHRDSLSDDMILGTDASALSPAFDSATEGLDTYGSSSDELEHDCPSSSTAPDSCPQELSKYSNRNISGNGGMFDEHLIDTETDKSLAPQLRDHIPPSASSGSLSRVCSIVNLSDTQDPDSHIDKKKTEPDSEEDASPALYVQLHGEAARRLGRDERPLQIQNDFLFKLGFKDPWRVQEEGMNTELGSLLRFYAGKPHSIESSERVQLAGTYNVRKGKLQLPVNRWSRRQVILCGTCLMVSSVKASHTGKMHILPLIGGKVEEVKKHSHCLAFSSAGPQSQTYYISFDSFTEHLRWHRHAAKMVSQRISSVDLSCCSLEKLPPNLLYSQDLTHLNLKHNFLPADHTLQQLQRFTRLRSLNLSNNHLGSFPLPICSISTLTEVNLSCNHLTAVHSSVGNMHNLQTFLLDGNLLSSLPDELGSLQRLTYLGLSFNEFRQVPVVLEQLGSVERLCMAGNSLSQLPLQAFRLLRVKHVDLRLNKISRLLPDEPDFLRHVSQLDVRDNGLTELDAALFPRLEVLHCERNRLSSLRLKGCMLKGLYAAHNELCELEVSSAATNLTYVDISRNCMESLPEWLSESKRLEVLDASHNHIKELPPWLLCSGSLRKLLVGHNQLHRLPDRVERPHLEVLDAQHNQLQELPCNLFLKSDSLRCLNVSANKLESLPPSSLSEESNSILQELYLTNNYLTDKCVPLLTGHTHLRVLHMAYNNLQTFPASKMAKLEELEEVDLSGNKLKAVPTTIMNCRRMHTLIAHSNCIEVFPEVMQLVDMKCVDLSCNELSEITLPENLPPKLQELDLTGNPRLNLDHKTLEQLNNIRCFRIDPPPSFSANEASGGPAIWSHGYTEASGVKNKLCVAALSVNSFCGNREALYGVFDGDRNVEVPYLLQCTMNDILAEELHKTKSEEDYMTNTFLVMQRKLGTAGQKLGGSAALCHIRHDPTNPAGCFTLTAANVGKCQAILCRDGKPLSLSLQHNISLAEEYSRIRQHKAIITEDNKVNGVTDSTRIMGYSFLYPSVLPRPHVHMLPLTPQDEFFVLGSRGLWDAVSPAEAVEAIRNVPDALAAAKKLCTLAQGYGCTDSLSAVVVRLSVSEDCCCCCCCSTVLPQSANGGATSTGMQPHHHHTPQPPASPGLYPPGAGGVGGGGHHGMAQPSSGSELSSEVSTSEMSSEVGSTASSDEPPLPLLLPDAQLLPMHLQPGAPMHLPSASHGHSIAPGGAGGVVGAGRSELLAASRGCCSLHATCLPTAFQRQLSSATFCSGAALSDNALDSEDEEPIAGVFSNGSRVEVEADVHCRGHISPTASAATTTTPSCTFIADQVVDKQLATEIPTPDEVLDSSPTGEELAATPEAGSGEVTSSSSTIVSTDTAASESPSMEPLLKEVVATEIPSSMIIPPCPAVVSPSSTTGLVETPEEISEASSQGELEQQPPQGQEREILLTKTAGLERGAGVGGSTEHMRTLGRRRGNGSVAPQERSHNLIEVAAEAPCRKPGGYFTAPAQPDPDDQFIIPPELEEEVKEIMKQHQQEQQRPANTNATPAVTNTNATPSSEQPSDYFDTPL